MKALAEHIAKIDRSDARWAAVLVLGAVAIGLVVGEPRVHGAVVAAVTAALAVGFVALLLWKTELAVPFMLVAVSFDLGGRITSEPLPITVYQMVLLVVLASWALRILWGDEAAKPRFTLVDVGMLLLLGAALWSLPTSLDPRATVIAFIRLVFMYLFYQFCSTFLRQKWVATLSATTLVVAGAFHGIVALAQVRGASIGNISVHVGGPSSQLRGSAFFDDPNYLAMMLSAAALVAAVRVVHARSLREALPWLAGAALCAGGVYVTYSRTGLLALAVGLVLIWALTPSGRKRWVFLAGVLAMAVLLVSNTGALIGRFTTLFDVDADQSAATRFYMIDSTVKIIRDYWAMGTGLSAFDKAYPAYRIVGSSFSVTKPHQLPLAMWAEMGVAGLVAELMLTFAVVRIAWTACGQRLAEGGIVVGAARRIARAGDCLSQEQKAGLAIIASFAVGSLFQYFLYVEYLWFGVALFAGSTVALRASSMEVRDV